MPKTIAANLTVTRRLVRKASSADRGKAGTLTAKPNTKGTTK